jgi:ABC-type polysaccharide/polyol phosphate export permease
MAVRLTLEAAAVFSAIVLWSKTRDVAWMLVISGVTAAYAGTVYSVLKSFGITDGASPAPFLPLLLSSLPPLFFLAAFVIEAVRSVKKTTDG